MNIEQVNYVVTDDDFPLFKKIRDVDDEFGGEMSKFFCDDYARSKSLEEYDAKCTHRTPEFHEYWIEKLDNEFKEISFKYHSVVWGGESIIEITSQKLLSSDEQKKIYLKMEEFYKYFTKVIQIKFDFTNHLMYKYAAEKDAIAIFEDWLFNNVVNQTEHALKNDVSSCKIRDGVYMIRFNKDVDENYAKKSIDDFILEYMKSWIDQDLEDKQ